MAKKDVTKMNKKQLIDLFEDLLIKLKIEGEDLEKQIETDTTIYNKTNEISELEYKRDVELNNIGYIWDLDNKDKYIKIKQVNKEVKTFIPFIISLVITLIINIIYNVNTMQQFEYAEAEKMMSVILIGLLSSIFVYKKNYIVGIIIDIVLFIALPVSIKGLIIYAITQIISYGILYFIAKMKIDKENKGQYKNHEKEYEKEKKYHDQEEKKIENERNNVISRYEKEINKLKEEIEDLKKLSEEYEKSNLEKMMNSTIFNDIDNMHWQYSNEDAIKTFKEYLEKGLCDTYKECINLYERELKEKENKKIADKRYEEEQEERRKYEQQRLEAIENQNKIINDKLEENKQELKEKLDVMDDKIKDINNDLIDVKIETEIGKERHEESMIYASDKAKKRDKNIRKHVESKYKNNDRK